MKNILVVGASSTIARSLLKEIDKQDVSLYGISRNITEGVSGNFMIADATDPNSLPDISCPLNGIIYFPGTLNLKPFTSLNIDDFRKDMEVNFFGVINILKKY